MAKKNNRTLSRYTNEAIKLLSRHIKAERLKRCITAQELTERAGISRGLLRRIENGDPACGIGVVFEVATLLGLKFFDSNYESLLNKNKNLDDTLMLLPSRVKIPNVDIDDDF